MIDNISIVGITMPDQFPNNCSTKNCKQNMESLTLCIPGEKPDIECINEMQISFCIDRYKVLNTVLGPKILVNISGRIKLIYTANNLQQSIHSAHWDTTFCEFILLEGFFYDTLNISMSNLFIGLEDVDILKCDDRSIEICMLYIICCSFNQEECGPRSVSRKSNRLESNSSRKMYGREEKKPYKTVVKNCKTINNCQTSRKGSANTHYYPIDYYQE